METIRLKPEVVTAERLDVRYNSRQAVYTRLKLAGCGIPTKAFGDMLTNIVCGPFGSTIVEGDLCCNGEILLAQPTNICTPFFTIDTEWRITRTTLEDNGLPVYPAGTVLFARVGIYPHVGVLPEWIGSATISSKLIAGMCKVDADPYYIHSFFQGCYGKPLLLAAQKVTAQPTIGTEELGSTLIPYPDSKVQLYIGDKVRQAERLRERARERCSSISELLKPFNPPTLPGGRTSRVVSDSLMDSLNPNAYMAKYVKAEQIARSFKHKSIEDLSLSVSDGPFGSNLQVTDYRTGTLAQHPVVRVVNCENGLFNRSDLIWIDRVKQAELSRSIVKGGDLLVTKAGRIGSASVYPSDLPEGNITSHLIRARLKPAYDPYYVAEFLETVVGRAITERHSFKSTRPELTKSEIEECYVPLIDESSMKAVGGASRQKGEFVETSNALIQVAKFLVEALIDGKVSESELKAAKEALERGDASLDRAILQRMTRKGMDMAGEPALFPYLDTLYATLTEVAGAEPALTGAVG